MDKKSFNLTLKDGTEIKVEYCHFTKDEYYRTMPHLAFYGDISGTGYKSHMVGFIEESEIEAFDKDIVSYATEYAELIRTEYVKELNKKNRRNK